MDNQLNVTSQCAAIENKSNEITECVNRNIKYKSMDYIISIFGSSEVSIEKLFSCQKFKRDLENVKDSVRLKTRIYAG